MGVSGIASIKLVVTHLLVALWWPRVAVALSVVSLSGIVWLARLLLSLRRLPVLIEGDRLVMRVGTLKRIDLDRARVLGLPAHWEARAFKRREAVKLSLIAWPNVVIDLIEPAAGRRAAVRVIAHRLDDPAGFTAALIGGLPHHRLERQRVVVETRGNSAVAGRRRLCQRRAHDRRRSAGPARSRFRRVVQAR